MVIQEDVPYTGLWPALLTPLGERGGIDVPRFAAHARRLLDAGCTGVTPFGTTGEGPSFTLAERRAALEGLVAGSVPAPRILASTSCAALPDVIELTRHAVQLGVRACLVLPPFFLKGVPDAGVIDAYQQVIDGVADSRLRIVLYHIPQISGVGLSHAVVSTLLQRQPQTIIGIKDSGGHRDTSLAFAQAFMPPLQVWVGNEPDLQTLAGRGSLGAVSGVGNIAPRLVLRLIGGAAQPGAEPAQQDMFALLKVLNGYGLTAAFKGVMAVFDQHPGWLRVRAPLRALSEAEFARITVQISQLGLTRDMS